MAVDKEKLKKGIVLVVALVAMGIALPFMMGSQGTSYFMVELPNGKQVLAQVADSPGKQLVGLFFTKELQPDQAILLIYKEEDFHHLWTKDSHFPIDMIWMDRNRTILHIQKDVPPCPEDPCPVYGPEEPEALYVMQTAAGFVDENKLEPGMSMIYRLIRPKG